MLTVQDNTADIQARTIADEFDEIVQELSRCFRHKNQQYATEDDLANFTKGAALLYRQSLVSQYGRQMGRYEALKAYVAKHIAHVFNNGIDGINVKESWNDIAVYAIIAMIIIKRHNALNTHLEAQKKSWEYRYQYEKPCGSKQNE